MIGPEEGLADLKPLLPFHPESYLLEILVGAVFVAILLLIFRRLARGGILGERESAISRARRTIAEANTLFRGGKLSLPDYCSRLSLIVRSYLQDTMAFPAANMTAAEISVKSPEKARTTSDFLFKCEARAYLPSSNTSDDVLAMGSEARRLIDSLAEQKDA